MIFPLSNLIEHNTNMYETTCAIVRRAFQLASLKDPEVDENSGKVVSLAARQIFHKEIEYRIEE